MNTMYHALVRYATDKNLLTKPYHADVKFMWQLDLDMDGSLISPELVPLTSTRIVQGKERTDRGVIACVPRMTRTSGVSPMLGSDDISYVLGWAPEADGATDVKTQADATARHRSWHQLTQDWANSPEAKEDPVPASIVRFLNTGVGLVEQPEDWTPKDGILIRVAGGRATDAASASPFWTRYVQQAKGASRYGPCLICGHEGTLVDSLPQVVKGPLIPGGQSSGVAPISINESAYGYGLRKGLGQVPICTGCGQAIPTALNHLLTAPERSNQTPDAALVWWIEGTQDFNPLAVINTTTDAEVQDFVKRLASGRGAEVVLPTDHFNSITLSGNASRLVVQDWTQFPVTDLVSNIQRWFTDIRLESTWGDGRQWHPLWQLAQACGRFNTDLNRYYRLTDNAGRHPHRITETLQQVALRGDALPRTVASHVVQRVAADAHVDELRIALLKLYLTHSPSAKEKPMPGLDHDNHRPAYLLGRLMAVYERTQYEAATLDGGSAPNATFADKYLAGAIASPRLVLVAGERQAAAWRSKLRRRNRHRFVEESARNIIGLLDPMNIGPTHASVDDQALFLLGYHHQRAFDFRAAREASVTHALANKKSADTNDESATTQESD